MRLLLQRVRRAAVRIDDSVVGEIGQGLLVLVGVGHEDTPEVVATMARKTVELRIFQDEEGRTNRSLVDVGGSLLVVSQFTLYADIRKGRRPSFLDAAPPELGSRLFDAYADAVAALGIPVARGVFGADMAVELVNDGPFTIWLDSAV